MIEEGVGVVVVVVGVQPFEIRRSPLQAGFI